MYSGGNSGIYGKIQHTNIINIQNKINKIAYDVWANDSQFYENTWIVRKVFASQLQPCPTDQNKKYGWTIFFHTIKMESERVPVDLDRFYMKWLQPQKQRRYIVLFKILSYFIWIINVVNMLMKYGGINRDRIVFWLPCFDCSCGIKLWWSFRLTKWND